MHALNDKLDSSITDFWEFLIMRHIRNFFHNISDVLLAIIIVAIATIIIFWRLQVILDYPKTIIGNQIVTEESAEEAAEEAAAEQ